MIRNVTISRCLWMLWCVALNAQSQPIDSRSRPKDCKDVEQNTFVKAENSLSLTLSILRLLREKSDMDTLTSTDLTSNSSHGTREIEMERSGTYYSTEDEFLTNGTEIGTLLPTSCADLYKIGNMKDGIYRVYPRWSSKIRGYSVFCDMKTEDGGWTVIQRRKPTEKQENFTRPWKEYKEGFGNLDQEFWLGNDNIHLLTNQDRVTLRLEFEDWEGQKRFAHYKSFRVASEENSYKMTFTEYFDSTAQGDQLKAHINLPFVTMDRDNSQAIAKKLSSGFWWPNVAETSIYVNLNGVFYPKGKHLNTKNGIFWHALRGRTYSMKRVEMKLRPEFFPIADRQIRPS